jgi:hypothetical protein
MKRPAPISLRIRNATATVHARQLLRRLDQADLLQRRVKWQAAKALLAVREMDAVAAPKLRSAFEIDRKRWESECRTIKQILERIGQRGV